MPVKAVLFDMFETLITHCAVRYHGAEMAADSGIPPEDFFPVWHSNEDDRTLGRMTTEEGIRQVLEANGRCTPELLARMMRRRTALMEAIFHAMHPGILPMLEGLRACGMKVGLISNCFSEEAEGIRRSPLAPCFDFMALSYELGLMKPDPAIYLRCTAALGVTPAECLYIGDGGSHELETAAALSMDARQALWYLREDSRQPVGRLADFPGLAAPEDVIRVCLEA